MQHKNILLAGQQNAGKSTLFNMLTGARQHVANYPGVTVDKISGSFSDDENRYTITDLPGTYSLTSFSLEERVARQALREDDVDVIVNVVDAANLTRSLNLTLQIFELNKPCAIVLNMMDVAQKEGVTIDSVKLAGLLGVPVVESIGRKGQGKQGITQAIDVAKVANIPEVYSEITEEIAALQHLFTQLNIRQSLNHRWLALRLLEGDSEVTTWLNELGAGEACRNIALNAQQRITGELNDYFVPKRHAQVLALYKQCVDVDLSKRPEKSLSQKIDSVVLHPMLAPICLLLTVFAIYQCSIVWGYELTNYTWPILASAREWIAGFLPAAGFLHDPYTRSLGLWVVDSANTLLNYVPIFLILFALIAILEDSGYMARIAFICDKVLHRFGLHGQSTLPMILSGVFAGGCAVPGIMATKGIPDNRARMATILTVPFMNCLAKVPLYTLLLSTFFKQDKALMMFYISTFTIIAALLVAKLLTKTVLKSSETAPFVMELPRYNLPTLRSVLTRAIERTWTYVKKVGTIVVAVSTVIFVLLQFPGMEASEQFQYQQRAEQAVTKFYKSIESTDYRQNINDDSLPLLVNYFTDFKRAKLNASGASASKAVNKDFALRNPDFFSIVVPPKGDKAARKANRSLRKLASERKKIRREMKELQLQNSLLGSFGRSIEPVTKYAGFDWKINVALFSSFAARESSVATLGVLFQPDEDSNDKLETRIGQSEDFAKQGELAAVALILFFALYPPCLATVMMIKVQTGQYRWMVLSMVLPTCLGFGVATLVHTVGNALAISGVAAMTSIYFTGLFLLLAVGFYGRFQQKRSPNIGAHAT
ncbi:ferrous iron transport protein B [Vibrio tapetis subsp. quintayensis]|uniref:ferrous iron transport protein B n=1 Tax=Vibrio tapetis TaxID=52443 RepID=UPI0025B2D998|nr:ferrous iron transport protein B [Vibrio tapetis]MDN3679797.1 ferrous iron transport protein B [Vibrio tapetis subsp. quintayensis]